MLVDDWLAVLAVPTAEQTARFADHFADHRSWYKHLPFFPPGATVVLFPNLHAGHGFRKEADCIVPYRVIEGDYFAHHSRMSTSDYLTKFGHWDFWIADNPRVLDPYPGPWLFSSDCRHRELLPEDRKLAWSCQVTAFLKPSPAMFILQPSNLDAEADAFRAAAGRFTGDAATARYLPVVNRLRKVSGCVCPPPDLFEFMTAEVRAQRETVCETLDRVRAVWSSAQSGGR
jgi:hypothetical protein